jgi:CRISPR/Cas system CSM-associated protein Csm3 (group 7 of RAMP superfamily)
LTRKKKYVVRGSRGGNRRKTRDRRLFKSKDKTISTKKVKLIERSLIKQDYQNKKISIKLMKLSYFSDKIEGKHEVARERWCPEEMRRRKERWRVDR